MTLEKDAYPEDAWVRLSESLTDERRNKMLKTVQQRSDKIRLVIQDTHHPHNVSACLRSAEAFGLLNVDIVNLREKFKPSTAAKGVQNWLRTHVYTSVESCVDSLRREGYCLAAGFPRPDAVPLEAVPVDRPIALIFGNEHAGVHQSWLPHLDYAFTIPMRGFVESLNISVSCAISLYELTKKSSALHGSKYFLGTEQQNALLNEWICKSVTSYQSQLTRLREKSRNT